ncbi:condensation domain-containing protein [Streptomyces rubiginosohelvolus]|uniref:condensation domain-containing protein n=1 Tax=Streptomyces rubiginosohelvolus TaxID=67362 RepID=UPI003711DDB1
MTTAPGRPLSVGQEALWFLYRMAPESPAYNVQAALRVHGALDESRLRHALHALAERHDVLCSTFAEGPGGPERVPGPPTLLPLRVMDVPESTDDDHLTKLVAEFGRLPFDLTAEGTSRALLVRRSPSDAVLAVCTHHIVSDATSQWLLLQDLLDLYGHQPPPPLKRTFDDYVAEEQHVLSGPRRAELAAFWADFCSGALAGELPTDRPRAIAEAGVLHGATCELRLPDELVPRLRETARRTKVTGFALLLGVFQSLVHRYGGRRDFLIGTPTTTRSGPGMRQVVGYLVNTLVVPAHFTSETTFAQAAGAAQRQVMTAMRNIAFPYALLAGEDPYSTRNPPVRMAFTMVAPTRLEPLLQRVTEAAATGTTTRYAGLDVAFVDVPMLEGQFDISVEMRQSETTLTAVFRYATDLFDESTVRRLLDHYVQLLTAAVDHPGDPVTGPDLVRAGELDSLLALGSDDDW